MTRTITQIQGAKALACWHSDDLSAVGDGNNVASWVDTIGGYDFANGDSGTQPIWHADYASSGYSSVKFDGTDDFLTLSSAGLNLPDGWIIFLLLRRPVSTAVQSVISCYNSATDYVRIRDQNNLYVLQDSSGFLSTATYNNTNNPAAIAIRYESGRCAFFTLADDSDKVEIPFVAATAGTEVASNTWYLGKRGDASTQPYFGAISQVIISEPDLDTRVILETLTQMRYNSGIADSDSEPVQPVAGGASFNHIGPGLVY